MKSLTALLAVLSASGTPPATAADAIPEEDYAFLSVTDGPCMPRIGVGIEPTREAACKRMTEPRRYRGIWQVEFEGSFFTPVGKQDCVETRVVGDCAELVGKDLPWPSRWACPRKFEVEFVGRRNLLPQFYEGSRYRVIVEDVISATRLPDPPHDPSQCDPAAP